MIFTQPTSKWFMGGVDALSDTKNLVRADQRAWSRDDTDVPYGERLDAIKRIRDLSDDLATYTSHGRIMGGKDMKRVASIPHTVLYAAIALEPDLLLKKEKFYGWLDRHPEYCMYHRQRGRRN